MRWVPDACTLPVADRPARLAEFDKLLRLTVRPPERTDRLSLRLHLPNDDATREQVRDLITRENTCCTFFAFDLRAAADATRLDIRVPPGQVSVIDTLGQRAVELHDQARA